MAAQSGEYLLHIAARRINRTMIKVRCDIVNPSSSFLNIERPLALYVFGRTSYVFNSFCNASQPTEHSRPLNSYVNLIRLFKMSFQQSLFTFQAAGFARYNQTVSPHSTLALLPVAGQRRPPHPTRGSPGRVTPPSTAGLAPVESGDIMDDVTTMEFIIDK